MESIEELYSLTLQLKSAIENKNNDRDTIIADIHIFLEKRGKIIETLFPTSMSSSDKEKLKEILNISEIVVKRMDEIKENIEKDLLHSKKGKIAFQGYNRAYSVPSFDGHFFDKKK
ncbi:hypothetical protein [Robertmurraya sp. Marseille-Q9965]